MRNKLLICILFITSYVFPATYYVDDVGGGGDGSIGSPWNSIQTGLNAATSGDTLYINPGDYVLTAFLNTANNGTIADPIYVLATDTSDKPYITYPGLTPTWQTGILNIIDSCYIVDGLHIDGEFQASQLLFLLYANHSTVRNCIFENSTVDNVVNGGSHDLTFNNCIFRFAMAGNDVAHEDAHNFSAQQCKYVYFNRCTFKDATGDCIQIDPHSARGAEGDFSFEFENALYDYWDSVFIDSCTFITAPLVDSIITADDDTFKMGFWVGENHIDTKTNPAAPAGYRANLYITNSTFTGLRNDSSYTTRANLNLKYTVNVEVTNCTFTANEYAMRCRGRQLDFYNEPDSVDGAYVIIKNCLFDSNDVAVWLELRTPLFEMYNCTFAKDTFIDPVRLYGYQAVADWLGEDNVVPKYLVETQGGAMDSAEITHNNLMLDTVPDLSQLDHWSNLKADSSWFVSVLGHDYHLSDSLVAPVDSGIAVSGLTYDIEYNARDAEIDIGAYEFTQAEEEEGSTPINYTAKKGNVDCYIRKGGINYYIRK